MRERSPPRDTRAAREVTGPPTPSNTHLRRRRCARGARRVGWGRRIAARARALCWQRDGERRRCSRQLDSLLQQDPQQFGLQKTVSAVRDIRRVRKQHLVHNDYVPKMEIDAQTYAVRADGQLLTCDPATVLPMAQRYFLF